MQKNESKSRLQQLKEQLFHFIFIIDTNQITNNYLQLLSIVLQLILLQYFYLHPNFTFLFNQGPYNKYYQSLYPYLAYIYPFKNINYSILSLSFYPIIIIIAIIVKQFGPNKILVPILQISIYLFPFLSIKIGIQIINRINFGSYIFIILPLGFINLIFGGLILLINKRSYKMIENFLILVIEINSNIYLIFIALLIRLIIVGYLLYPRNRYFLGYFYQWSLFIIVVTCHFTEGLFLNYIGFLFLIIACLAIGANATRIAFMHEKNTILDYADILQDQDQETAIFQIYKIIQQHYTNCEIVDCSCQNFQAIGKEGLRDWVYKFQEQLLQRKQTFQGRYQYAQKCWSHYDFRLNGLVKVCENRPSGLIEEYLTYKVCLIYELNLRRQDKNYKYGQPYQNSQEQLQNFHNQLLKILHQIRTFWQLIKNFDGSTKFLNQILFISKSINDLRQLYSYYQSIYDQQIRQFKYSFELFASLILNQQIIQQDEVFVPQSIAFLITNNQTILNANNSFLILISQTFNNLIGTSFSSLIPDVYREIHKKWTTQFIQKVQSYQDKIITKCLCINNMQIKIVDMQHKILPRFLQGLQIYTTVKPSIKYKKQKKQTFIFLAQKDTFYIKNVQSTFFDIIKFKVNQRNFKLLQQMSLTSIFQNFSLLHSENPTKQVTIFPHFLQQFTHTKGKKKSDRKNRNKSTLNAKSASFAHQSSKISSLNQNDMVFQFTVLPNNRTEDPYVKVQFTLKQQKQQQIQTTSQSSQIQQIQQNIIHKKKKKQQNFGFFIPYYLILILAFSHIFYALGRLSFDDALNSIKNRYQFYLDFDYTTLNVLNAYTGINKTQQLRTLWIQGYGDFSEAFNAFRRTNDTYFNQYFNSKITVNFHNKLFDEIQQFVKSKINEINIYKTVLLAILLLTIAHYTIDLILTLRYTFVIEGKVGALLLQFVIIQTKDIGEILLLIDNFQSNILNIQENSAFKVPLQTVQQSALQLLKGGGMSLNNSINQNQQDQQLTPSQKRSTSGRKRGASWDQKQRVSISLLKSQFKNHQKSSFKKQSAGIRQQSNLEKNRNINLFKRKYRSCSFIVKANKGLFLLIFCAFVISIGILVVTFSYLYTPFNALPIHLQLLDKLEQSRIILLKSQTQILINTTGLSPDPTLSDLLIIIIHQLDQISSGNQMSQFNKQFMSYLNENGCGKVVFNCSLLNGDNNLHNYGIKVIVQYLQEYFRLKDKIALIKNNLQNQFIIYSQVLFTQLINDFIINSQQFCIDSDSSQLKMIIIGSFGLLLGMILLHISLRQFKNRIDNSRSLLQIIPKQIKKKQQKDIEQLTLKQLSTP